MHHLELMVAFCLVCLSLHIVPLQCSNFPYLPEDKGEYKARQRTSLYGEVSQDCMLMSQDFGPKFIIWPGNEAKSGPQDSGVASFPGHSRLQFLTAWEAYSMRSKTGGGKGLGTTLTQELRKSGKKKKLEWINHELPFQAWPCTCTSSQAKPARPQAQGQAGQGSLEKSRGCRN